MATAKLFLCFVITAIVVIVGQVNSVPQVDYYAAANKSHNLVVGTRLPGDRLVLKEHVVKNSSWMQVSVVEKTFKVLAYQRISLVQALDQKTNDNGAIPSILYGGPGHNNVTLRFKSKRGHGINFVVQIYALY